MALLSKGRFYNEMKPTHRWLINGNELEGKKRMMVSTCQRVNVSTCQTCKHVKRARIELVIAVMLLLLHPQQTALLLPQYTRARSSPFPR